MYLIKSTLDKKKRVSYYENMKKKRSARKVAVSSEPSQIIQIGVVFIIIAAMFLIGYTVKIYR